jgi:O-antigen ligase
LIILTLSISIPNPFFNRLQSSFNFNDGSNIGRIEMWRVALEDIQDKPLLGWGLGSFAQKLNTTDTFRNPIYAHNLLLDFGAETGLLNMFILFIIITSPIFYFIFLPKEDQKKYFLNKIIATCFVVFFIHSIFETPFFSIRVFPLFLILLSIEPNIHFNNHPKLYSKTPD